MLLRAGKDTKKAVSLRPYLKRMDAMQMVDLNNQYLNCKEEMDAAIGRVLAEARFINGPEVASFQRALEVYTGSRHVVTCGSGTDAIMIALMALGLKPGDEIVTVPFTFVATAEAAALFGIKPVFVDVRWDTFNMDVDQLESAITERTKAIVPVHLFGQCADMERILDIARKHNLYVVEDACQAIGATVRFSDGSLKQAGTMGDVGCVSFFPSKNLGCYGDGGALFVQDDDLAERVRRISAHGASVKYHHQCIGVNSRLDTLQAAILNVKLKHLDEYVAARRAAAAFYNRALGDCRFLELPVTAAFASHVFHQYTLKCNDNCRDHLMRTLQEAGIPFAVYYPIPLHLQEAYAALGYAAGAFPVSETLAKVVLSLPMHTELNEDQLCFITETIKKMNER